MDFPMSVGPCSSKQFIIFWKGKKNSSALTYFFLIFKIIQDTYRAIILLWILNYIFLELGLESKRTGRRSLKSLILVIYHKMLCKRIKHSHKQ